MKYFLLGDEDAVLGFGMVGVEGRTALTKEEAELAFSELIRNRDIGIIIITERIADLIRPQVDRFVFTESFPLILEIPDRKGRLPGRPSIREMVNAAIGVRL